MKRSSASLLLLCFSPAAMGTPAPRHRRGGRGGGGEEKSVRVKRWRGLRWGERWDWGAEWKKDGYCFLGKSWMRRSISLSCLSLKSNSNSKQLVSWARNRWTQLVWLWSKVTKLQSTLKITYKHAEFCVLNHFKNLKCKNDGDFIGILCRTIYFYLCTKFSLKLQLDTFTSNFLFVWIKYFAQVETFSTFVNLCTFLR